jgi:hypothetical protein
MFMGILAALGKSLAIIEAPPRNVTACGLSV